MHRSALFAAFILAMIGPSATSAPVPRKAHPWSGTVNNLQARITFEQRPRVNGTRILVPYLELRNVGNNATPLKVRCDTAHVKFQLIDANGKPRDGWGLPRSGPHPDPGTVVLPLDSSMRVGMYCSNWGIPKDAAALIATDSGVWVLTDKDKGKVFLRAVVTADNLEADPSGTWSGTLQTPDVKVEWNK